jgi:hypothetical protein
LVDRARRGAALIARDEAMGARSIRWLRRWAWDVLGILATITYALPSLGYPFARDHPIHWYIGRRLLEGEMPYVSGISTKPPAVFVIHALSQLLFGDHMWSIRILDLAFVIANGVLIATFRPRRATSDGALDASPRQPGEIGAACVLVGMVHYTFFDFSDTGHPELWQAFFMLAPAWVLARAPNGVLGPRHAFLAGALACVAVLHKHPAVVSGVVVGIAIVVVALARGAFRRAAGTAALYTLGVAAVLGLTMLVFWVTGSFGAFWEVMVDFILDHYAPGDTPMDGAPSWLTYDHGLLAVVLAMVGWCAGAAVSSATRDRRERRLGLWIAVIVITTAVSVAIQRRALFSHTFTYYFVVMTPFLALAMAWGLRRALPRRGGAQVATAIAVCAACLMYGPEGTHNAAWSYRAEWSGWIDVVRGVRRREELQAAYFNSPLDAFVRQQRVADAILARKREGDTLCVDGFIPILYQLTDMRCPSRYFVGEVAYAGPPTWRTEYETMLRERPPTLYVTFSDRPQRIHELERRGFVRHDVEDGGRPHYVILERRSP